MRLIHKCSVFVWIISITLEHVALVDCFHLSSPMAIGQFRHFRHTSSCLHFDRTVYEINRAMDDLAEQCGDIRKPVVALASQVEEIYDQAKEKDVISFNVMLKAWGKACQSMERQKHSHSNGRQISIHDVPTVAIYTPRDAAEHLTKRLLNAEEECQHDLDTCTVVPDETSYNIAIDAWAKSAVPDSTQVAERLLSKMIHNPRLEPSSITYNAVLDSHAHSSDPDSLDRMNKIWNHMQKLADNGSTKIRPNLRTVNMMLTACVRKAELYKDFQEKMESAQRARTILDDLKDRSSSKTTDLIPDVMTYSIVMDAFARVGTTEAAEGAEQIMEELKQSSRDHPHDVRHQPNVRTYTTLISAWSRTSDPRAAERSEQLLEEMEQVYTARMADASQHPLERGEETTKPNARTYNAVIHALSRSQSSDKAKRVLKILLKMREDAKTDAACAPLLTTYNQAIDACAKTRGDGKVQVEALKIAFAILKTIELDPNVLPDDDTFTNIIKAVSYLLPATAERNKIALATFEKAKASGMVSAEVVRTLRKALDNETLREVLKPIELDSGIIDQANIPKAWSKNVAR